MHWQLKRTAKPGRVSERHLRSCLRRILSLSLSLSPFFPVSPRVAKTSGALPLSTRRSRPLTAIFLGGVPSRVSRTAMAFYLSASRPKDESRPPAGLIARLKP